MKPALTVVGGGADEGPRRFQDVPVERLRHYRAEVASRTTRAGRHLEGRSVLDSHKALMTFFRRAAEEEYPVDQKILSLKRPRSGEGADRLSHRGRPHKRDGLDEAPRDGAGSEEPP
ncbi:MAG: hypothetical protein J2P43_02620 [Candidatus Dormibacteraeota bacterium]|nr:hypothetical protein [Candidatus Dormibacteraeota bacterium]